MSPEEMLAAIEFAQETMGMGPVSPRVRQMLLERGAKALEARGKGWMALFSMEAYGPHFSVSGRRRKPTDDQVTAARKAFPEATICSAEVRHKAMFNPYVRHFISEAIVDQTPYKRV